MLIFRSPYWIELYNVIQVITINVPNCKVAGAILEDVYPSIFRFECLVHALNLLMHDIIKMKNPDCNGLVPSTRRVRRS